MNNNSQGEKIPPIYIVSGGKGLAGDAIVQSVLIQFPNNKVPVIIAPDVLNQEKMDEVISKALAAKGIIVHTMVDPEALKAALAILTLLVVYLTIYLICLKPGLSVSRAYTG
jgi:regulator of PEP synthase PpsR (kinase-PPPase family)